MDRTDISLALSAFAALEAVIGPRAALLFAAFLCGRLTWRR
jgi:hypothetical protein